MSQLPVTPPKPVRRIGWIAALGICFVLYIMLHLRVTAVHAEVVQAEREIVQLEEHKLLLETEFLTRANHVQLAAWNRVDFGFQAPEADQFIDNPRQLASFGVPRSADAPAPIRLAGLRSGEDLPEFPQLVSPLTGEPVDPAVLQGAEAHEDNGSGLAVTVISNPLAAPVNRASQRATVIASAGAAGN
ncbi:hypothetical protein [Erythrobacter sp. EC-HK427]|uniref:hypothetical protein n=1 Tax=Erythrobacter sp. EC-HK427 TaxID=2038396 RepID=UPI001250E6CC|nr:hypothetical protein [Erythrobacter sp. EC-HK427]VVS97525.1 conserved hypothetical protein [Erythrobacter sp. EC-HK427]